LSVRLFIDFGSTFTKVVAFDTEREELAARAQAPSTVDTDVALGLDRALAELGRAYL
jgi:sugar (pentulose or hexulose) kinase